MSNCPCCGASIPHDALVVDLNTNTVTRWGKSARLTRMEADILSVLSTTPGQLVGYTALHIKVWGLHSDEGTDTVRVTRVLLSRIRKRLAGLGIEIRNVWGKGYVLVLLDPLKVAA